MPINNYCTLEEVREEGFGLTPPFTDPRVNRAIRIASTLIESATGRWFGSKSRSIQFDGTGGTILPVYVPIIRIDTIEIVFDISGVTDSQVVDLASAQVYNRHLTMGLTAPDDRDAPRLELRAVLGGDFFITRWPRGEQNIRLTGKFGFTELDPDDAVGETVAGSQIPLSEGEVPADIQDVCIRLVKRHLPLLANDSDMEDVERGFDITEVETRDQKIKWGGKSSSSGLLGGSMGLTGDRWIDSVLQRYMRPPTMVMV